MAPKKPFDPLALTDADKRLLSALPEHMRVEAEKAMVAAKKTRHEVVIKNRTEFSATLNDKHTIVIRGLNNRFPLGIRWDSLEIVLNNEKTLRPLIAEAKAKTANVRSIAPAVESLSVEQLEAALAAKKKA